ncbi:MAG: Z1 domain-containing protein [Chromatiaceae bacterium]|nr:Z1 domain-containing protein [Chromatiaceae bacterium]
MPSPIDITQTVLKIVQELLRSDNDHAAITPALIDQKIDLVLGLNAAWGNGLNRQAVTDELIRRFSLWIGQNTTLRNMVGHQAWLNTERKKDWRYWQRYREWLEPKISWKAVDGLDRSIDSILGLLEDPQRDGPWDRRGLVVGHVQSGKTSNYTGLICKAADAGYKIIIVLAGLHNNLRSQTQMRLDEGFLGYETSPVHVDQLRIIGVGEIDSDIAIRPNFATNRANNGDFSKAIAKNLGITPEQRPWLFVVKKNKSVLERLILWIRDYVANTHDPENGRKIVNHLPLLLIDDEADHASVDTGEQPFDAEGKPDEEHQPTAINTRIRRILHLFSRSAYVGYTATPFANIFIHERGKTQEEGPDLFPSAFIINLGAPSNYTGPTALFGLRTAEDRVGGLPLIRLIEDHASEDGRSGWIPHRHKNGHVPRYDGTDAVPPSLAESIDAFLIACAIRKLRGQGAEHSSMLIHVTRFNSVQAAVYRQVSEYVRLLSQRLQRGIDSALAIDQLQALWLRDFLPTTEALRSLNEGQVPEVQFAWESILAVLPDMIRDITVRMINGTAKDALDYVEHQSTGLKVIAIGGDKLARGLTLEGLCTSYFLRASTMYDTLMQMGRWFGYRPGYLDLTRLYTTSDLTEWFGHIADASEELREEFELMAASGATPREYGLKIQSHPVLMVTSRLKMRTARNLMLSFSGQLLETVALFRERTEIEKNFAAATKLIKAIGEPHEISPERDRCGRKDSWKGSFLWSAVNAEVVIEFFQNYRTHASAYKVRSDMISDFISTMNEVGELKQWTVALMGLQTGNEHKFTPSVKICMNKRTASDLTDRYSFGRLLDPKDEAIDLDEAAWKAALDITRAARKPDPARMKESEPEIPNGPAIRKVRGFGAEGIPAHPERGLLLLYLLDPSKASKTDVPVFPKDMLPIIAFGVSFPGSNAGRRVEYKVNNVLWQQEYGDSE